MFAPFESWPFRILILTKNPAFGPKQIRELTEIFVDKAAKVCSIKE
jgi:hypothetical protein